MQLVERGCQLRKVTGVLSELQILLVLLMPHYDTLMPQAMESTEMEMATFLRYKL